MQRELVERHYDRAATNYDRSIDLLSGGLDLMIRRDVVDILDPQPGEEILDLGCGTGRIWPLIAGRMQGRGKVTLVDLSREMLSIATERVRSTGLEVEAVHADVREFETDSSFDRVLSTYLLTTLPDFAMIPPRLYDWVRPAGRVVLTDDRLPPGWFLGPGPMLGAMIRQGYPDVLHAARREMRGCFGNVMQHNYFFGLIFLLMSERA